MLACESLALALVSTLRAVAKQKGECHHGLQDIIAILGHIVHVIIRILLLSMTGFPCPK
jgi:hypothetical protein